MKAANDLTRFFRDRPQPVPLFTRLRRSWLLFLRWYLEMNRERHARLERHYYVRRRLVLIALTKEDEK